MTISNLGKLFYLVPLLPLWYHVIAALVPFGDSKQVTVPRITEDLNQDTMPTLGGGDTAVANWCNWIADSNSKNTILEASFLRKSTYIVPTQFLPMDGYPKE